MTKKPIRDNQSLYRQIAPVELKKGDLRKLQIVEATIKCISALGFERTNYETVGKACNMKRPHVAYHFPKWDELIDSTLKFVYATGHSIVVDYLKDAKNTKERLAAYIEGTFSWFETYPHQMATLTLFWHLASVHEKHRKAYTQYKRLGVERVYAMLNSGKSINTKSSSWKTSQAIHDLIVGACVEWMSCERKESIESVVSRTTKAAMQMAKWK